MSPFSEDWLLFMRECFFKSDLFVFERANVVYFPFNFDYFHF